jgi:hypothetical protein
MRAGSTAIDGIDSIDWSNGVWMLRLILRFSEKLLEP